LQTSRWQYEEEAAVVLHMVFSFKGSYWVQNRSIVVVCSFLVLLLSGGPTLADSQRDRVVDAALKTYIHGMNAVIAQQEVDPGSVPVFLQLLADPAFPRRDNVVAFRRLGRRRRPGLSEFCSNPPADVESAVEDRALRWRPMPRHTHIAAAAAHAELLGITRHGANGGVIVGAAARGSRAGERRDDLLRWRFGPRYREQ
jgi:hypothetical protein